MEPNTHNDNGQNNLPGMPNVSRKRSREHETTSQRQKREKATARQRRKRQRDRNSVGMGIMAFTQPNDHQQQHEPPQGSPPDFSSGTLTPEEIARRDRVRTGARERQRKHRQLVKQRKMRELGLDMGNEIMPGMEEVHYRVNADGQYQQVLPHELQHNPHAINQNEPPFPQGQPPGGQTFASTLLLSFSCAPLLKQHLLRSLVMTNEELASLEPMLAEAWDRWDHQRRMHYAEQAANVAKAGGPGMSGPSGYPNVDMNDPTANPYPGDPSQPSPNDFRARFHRSLVAPSPFRTFTTETQSTATISTPTSASGSGPPSDPIDPSLNSSVGATSELRPPHGPSSLDPDLGQARGEIESVVGKLETR